MTSKTVQTCCIINNGPIKTAYTKFNDIGIPENAVPISRNVFRNHWQPNLYNMQAKCCCRQRRSKTFLAAKGWLSKNEQTK